MYVQCHSVRTILSRECESRYRKRIIDRDDYLHQVMRPTTSIGLHMPATSTDRTGCGIQVHGAAVLLRTPHKKSVTPYGPPNGENQTSQPLPRMTALPFCTVPGARRKSNNPRTLELNSCWRWHAARPDAAVENW